VNAIVPAGCPRVDSFGKGDELDAEGVKRNLSDLLRLALGESNLVLCVRRAYGTAVPCDGLACKELRDERNRIRQRCVDSAAVILAGMVVCLDPGTSMATARSKRSRPCFRTSRIGRASISGATAKERRTNRDGQIYCAYSRSAMERR
jgi:hypothetical protein